MLIGATQAIRVKCARDRLRMVAGAIFVVVALVGCGNGDEPTEQIDPAESTQQVTPSASDDAETQWIATPGTLTDPTVNSTEYGDEPFTKPTAPAPGPTPTRMASAFDPDGDGSFTLDEFVLAMKGRIDEFDWPSDFGMSDAIVDDIGALYGPDDGFESGYDITVLKSRNNCAWLLSWLDARETGDAQAEADALRVLQEVVPYSTVFSPDTTAVLVEVTNKAALGDPAPVNQYVQVNCGQMVFANDATDGE